VNLLVHGVIEASSAEMLASISVPDSPTPDHVIHDDLAAVVSPTPEAELFPSRANLLRHTRILEALGARTTVLPMRFGVLVPDAEALIRDYLAPSHDGLVKTIDRLRNHVELRVRGRYHEPAVIEAVLAADPRAARLRGREAFEAKMELGERIVTGIEQRRVQDVDRALDALTPHASAVAPSVVTAPLDAFLVSFLVHDDARRDFEHRLDRLGEQFAPVVALELAGPVPPFSFAAEQAASWA
jgi:hypothetical protein